MLIQAENHLEPITIRAVDRLEPMVIRAINQAIWHAQIEQWNQRHS